MHRTLILALVCLCSLSVGTPACTFFSYAGDGLVLFGNSEDHYDENAMLWYVPGSGNEHGCLFLGFSTSFAQGGVNTAGLAFDAAAIDRTPLNDHPELPTPDPMNFCEIVLRQCATIEEAVELIGSYNLSYVGMAQFQFADRTGASVVVAPGPDREIAFVYPEAPYQVTTNTNTAIYPQLHRNCSRHRRTTKALAKVEAGESDLSLETFAAILGCVANLAGPSETMYSNVFDLTNGIAYIYYRHDFEHVAVLDIAELEIRGESVESPMAALLAASE
jgi:hypothetical protein